MMNDFHAREFIKSFISKERKHRYLALLESKMGERAFASRLAHLNTFDEQYIQSLPKVNPALQVDFIYKFVHKIFKQDKCYIISENQELSSKEIPVQGSIEIVFGKPFGSILSFIPGKLAYYESESPQTGMLFYKG